MKKRIRTIMNQCVEPSNTEAEEGEEGEEEEGEEEEGEEEEGEEEEGEEEEEEDEARRHTPWDPVCVCLGAGFLSVSGS
ncbi:hypothetical protein NHX12_029393, partial [Muraenolepis orangiensis]